MAKSDDGSSNECISDNDSFDDPDNAEGDGGSWCSEEFEKKYRVKTLQLKNIASRITVAAITAVEPQFCTQGSFSQDLLQVSITDFGNLEFPISRDSVNKLIEKSTLAGFGLGNESLIDQSIRDTNVLQAQCLQVNIQNMDQLMQSVQMSLGIDQECKLVPKLHNMLIYKVDQFFDFHQDTEKIDGMIATMVISLPSAHIGGDLIVHHSWKTHRFSSAQTVPDCVKFAAFYSDCLHKIDRVHFGFRVVLTYNLVIETGHFEPKVVKADIELLSLLKAYFGETCHFATLWNFQPPPTLKKQLHTTQFVNGQVQDINNDHSLHEKKLVFLLNHSYSQLGLCWAFLRGKDRRKATALVAAAQEMELEVHLALVDMREYWRDYNDDCDGFLSFTANLTCFKNIYSQAIGYKDMKSSSNEVCWNLGNEENFIPYKKNKQYTGNAGCTEDRWYKRAAIVIWPKASNNRFLFYYNNEEGVKKLKELLQSPGKQEAVLQLLEGVNSHCMRPGGANLQVFVQVAIYIKDANKALCIASYIVDNLFTQEHAFLFLELQIAYGIEWCNNLINTTKIAEQQFSENLLSFVGKYIALGGDRQLAISLVKIQYTVLIKPFEPQYKWSRPDSEETELFKYYLLLKCCSEIDEDSTISSIVSYLMSHKFHSPIRLGHFIVKCINILKANHIRHLDVLVELVLPQLNKQLIAQKQKVLSGEKDWSIDCYIPCGCEYCKQIENFLKDSKERKYRVTSAEEECSHICSVIENLNLPVVTLNLQRAFHSEFEIRKRVRIPNYLPARKLEHLEVLVCALKRAQKPSVDETNTIQPSTSAGLTKIVI